MTITTLELTTNIGLGGFDALSEEQRGKVLGWVEARSPKAPDPPKAPKESTHERVLKKFRERGFK